MHTLVSSFSQSFSECVSRPCCTPGTVLNRAANKTVPLRHPALVELALTLCLSSSLSFLPIGRFLCSWKEIYIYIYIYTASQPGCVSFVNNSQAPGSLLTGPGSPLFCRVPNSQRSLGGYSFCPPYLQGCVLSTRLFLTSHTVKRCRDQSENLESRSCLLSNSNNVEFHFSGTTVFFQYNIHSLYKEDTLSKETLEIKRKLGIAIQLPFCLVLEDKWTDSEEG